MAYFRFDDVGRFAQDSTAQTDWLAEWSHAATLYGGEIVTTIDGPVQDSVLDRDEDGLPDKWEVTYFGDLSATPDGDNDLDGLTNLYEYLAGLNPTLTDSDGNQIEDGEEDTDGDGIANIIEQNAGLRIDLADSDGDGLPDGKEMAFADPGAVYSGALEPLSPYVSRNLLLDGSSILLPLSERFSFLEVEEEVTGLGPQVEITAPIAGASIDDRFVTVTGTASSTSAIVALNFYVNNLLADSIPGGESFSRTIVIAANENEITVEAEDGAGLFGYGSVNITSTVAEADIRVTQTWDVNGDLDTWLVDPTFRHMGWTTFGPGYPDVFNGVTTDAGQIPGSDLDIDDISGTGPENITVFSGSAEDGVYQVWSNNYSNGGDPQSTIRVLVHEGQPDERLVEFGPTTMSVTDGNGTNEEAWWHVTDISWPSGAMNPPGRAVSGSGTELVRRTNTLEGFTIEMWVRPTAALQSGALFQYANLSGLVAYSVGLNENRPYFQTMLAPGVHETLEMEHALAGDSWNHLAFTFNGVTNEIRINVNGVSVGKSITGLNITPGGVAHLNGPHNSTTLTGVAIDEVRVWRAALSDKVIDAQRFRAIPATDELFGAMVLYYMFDDGGETVDDYATDVLESDLTGLDIRIENAASARILYIDVNGNLYLDDEDETFVDVNEDGLYDAGDTQVDLGTNAVWDSIVGATGLTDGHLDALSTTNPSPLLNGAPDSDHDGIEDWYELRFGDLTMDPTKDLDSDGLTNLYEFLSSTSPLVSDTDGNTIIDAFEDRDGDDLDNGVEQFHGTDPRLVDTDDDGTEDGAEVVQGTAPAFAFDPVQANALLLDGSGYVQAPWESNRLALEQFTIEAWIYPTANSGTILGRQVTEGLYNYHFYLDGGRPTVAVSPATGDADFVVSAAESVPQSVWTHVAATFDGNNLAIYVNGIRVIDLVADLPVHQNGYGPTWVRVGEGFSGAIDNVRIWEHTRFAGGMRAAMHRQIEADANGLVLQYLFDDGGETIEDHVADLAMDWKQNWLHAGRLHGTATVGTMSPSIPVEERELDADDDGLPDSWELVHFGDLEADGDDDADGDGLSNYYEWLAGTIPTQLDSDLDGIADAHEDADGDGLTNGQEQELELHPGDADSDNDGITDLIEQHTHALLSIDPLDDDGHSAGYLVGRSVWVDIDRDGVYTDGTDILLVGDAPTPAHTTLGLANVRFGDANGDGMIDSNEHAWIDRNDSPHYDHGADTPLTVLTAASNGVYGFSVSSDIRMAPASSAKHSLSPQRDRAFDLAVVDGVRIPQVGEDYVDRTGEWTVEFWISVGSAASQTGAVLTKVHIMAPPSTSLACRPTFLM